MLKVNKCYLFLVVAVGSWHAAICPTAGGGVTLRRFEKLEKLCFPKRFYNRVFGESAARKARIEEACLKLLLESNLKKAKKKKIEDFLFL